MIIGRVIALASFIVVTVLCSACGSGDIYGHEWDTQNECWGPEESAGWEFEVGSGCDASEEVARDEDGNYWRFRNSCIPDDFERVGWGGDAPAHEAPYC
jgi:hypothetical protein